MNHWLHMSLYHGAAKQKTSWNICLHLLNLLPIFHQGNKDEHNIGLCIATHCSTQVCMRDMYMETHFGLMHLYICTWQLVLKSMSAIDMPNSNIIFCTPIIRVLDYVVSYVFKNGYQKDICSRKIGLYAQYMIIILHSTINMILFLFFSFFGGEVNVSPLHKHMNLHLDDG